MNLLAALLIADNVRQRAEQGDCPTIPAQPIETLEEVVMELQRALARDAVAEVVGQVKVERDRVRAALGEAREALAYYADLHPVSESAITESMTAREAIQAIDAAAK